MRIWFDVITYADARALKRWWSWHGSYSIERSQVNPRYYKLIQNYTYFDHTSKAYYCVSSNVRAPILLFDGG